jgi:capsule polysaccharide export protein KpsE/RkpR
MSDEFSGKKEEFSTLHFLAFLIKHKWFIIIFTVVVTGAAVWISLLIPNQYLSTANLVPPQSNDSFMGGAMGALSSTLRDFGLTKLTGQSGEGYSFIVILQSRSVMDTIIKEFDLASVYDIPDTMMSKIRKTFSQNLDITYEKEGNYFINVLDEDPNRAANIANRIGEIANEIATKLYNEEAAFNLTFMNKQIKNIDSTIKFLADTLESFSRRTLIFSPTDQAASISKALSDLKAEEIKNEIAYEYYKSYLGENDHLTQSIKTLKEQTQAKVAEITTKPGFAGNFTIESAAEEGIEFMRLFTEFETYSKVKAYLLPMIEKARLDEIKKVKNLFVLDEAVPADRKEKPKRMLIVAGAFVGSFIFSIFILVIINSISSVRKQLKHLG